MMAVKCEYDPTEMKDAPIGMYHCPECGEMVIAGLPHPDYSLLDSPLEAEQKESDNGLDRNEE